MHTLHKYIIVSIFTLGVRLAQANFRIMDVGQRGGYARWPRGARRQADAGVNGVRLGERSGQIRGHEGEGCDRGFLRDVVWPCMAAIPHNNELLKKYKDKGLVIVGVCTSSRGQEKMEQNAKDKGIEYSVARDPDQKSAKAWAVHYYPTYAIIDRKRSCANRRPTTRSCRKRSEEAAGRIGCERRLRREVVITSFRSCNLFVFEPATACEGECPWSAHVSRPGAALAIHCFHFIRYKEIAGIHSGIEETRD